MVLQLYGNDFQNMWSLDGTFQKMQVFNAANDCCCGAVACDCDEVCASPNWRVTFSGLNCPPFNDPEICVITATYSGTMTEGLVADIPAPKPCDDPLRYWTVQPTMACADPSNPLIELACCSIGGFQLMYLRINGQDWCLLNPEDECLTSWNKTSIASSEFDTAAGCCGTAVIEISCDALPAQVCQGLVPSNAGVGGCG